MKLMKLAVMAACVVWLTGCATATAPTMGLFYTQVKGPIDASGKSQVTRTGQACATNLLGLVATGDASIEAAKKNGGVTQVSTVDHDSTSILGLYAKFCTIVSGS